MGATTFAQQSALLAAKTYQEEKQADKAQAALAWVAEKSPDEGLRAVGFSAPEVAAKITPSLSAASRGS